MEIKETPDMWVLRIARRLCLRDVKHAAAECGGLITRQIERSGLTVAGPWVLVARHLPRDRRTPFDWAICRPVEKPAAYEGEIALVHLEPIIVAAAVHRGPVRTLFSQGYAPLVAAIERSRHDFSGESREVYHDWRGPGAPYQKIEIQFGLSR
jgi:hypothetical protein